MPFLTQGKTNWKFLAIVAVLAVIVGGGVLFWQYSILLKEEITAPEEITEEGAIEEDKKLIFNKLGFSLVLPDYWDVKIEEKSSDSFSFSFVPPEGLPSGWDFWGEFYLNIYEAQLSIDEWIEEYLSDYKNDLLVEEIENVGGKPTFVLNIKEKDRLWVPRYIILGNEYSYEYSFSQDGAAGFTERIIEEIFPNIVIKLEEKTINWQTYRSEEYGFEFKYPAAFDKFEYCKIREEDGLVSLGGRLSVLVSDAGGLDFSEYIAKEKEKSLHEQAFPPPEEAWHEEGVYIGGTKGTRVTWFHGSRYSQIIYFLKDNTIFKIGWTAGPSCLDYYIGQGLLDEDEAQNELYIFEQIPNTFRFLE